MRTSVKLFGLWIATLMCGVAFGQAAPAPLAEGEFRVTLLGTGSEVVLAMAAIAPVVPWVAVRWAKPSPPETTPDKGRMD